MYGFQEPEYDAASVAEFPEGVVMKNIALVSLSLGLLIVSQSKASAGVLKDVLGAPVKVVKVTLGVADKSTKKVVDIADQTTKSTLGLADKSTKTVLGAGDKSVKTVVGETDKAAKDVVRTVLGGEKNPKTSNAGPVQVP